MRSASSSRVRPIELDGRTQLAKGLAASGSLPLQATSHVALRHIEHADMHMSSDTSWEGVTMEQTFLYKVGAVYLLLLLDLVLSAYLEQLTTSRLIFHVLAFSVQLFVLFATWIAFYVLLSSTFLVKKALYARVFVQNRGLFTACIIHFLLFLLLRLYRLALEFLHCPHDRVWHRPGFYPIYIVQKIVAMLYYVFLTQGLHRLVSKPKLYTAECMQLRPS